MKKLSRRKFLGKSALVAGLAPIAFSGFPFIRSARANEPGASDKIRLGVIGCGDQGLYDFKDFLANPEVDCAVVCDVDDARIARILDTLEKTRGKKADSTKDFRHVLDRKDVDIVLVATPDHWHAMPTVLACQAGKDVYVEKPLAKTIDEGRAMREAARRHDRVVQMGSQWKSCKHIIEATDLIRAGKIGKVHMVRGWAYLDWVPSIGSPADCPPPPGVDYETWLGPAPERPFNPNRFHFKFRWFWDYAGGLMTDWGVHLINMMLMGMGPDSPLNVFSTGAKYRFTDNSETPDSQIAVYQFPDYILVWEHKAGLNNGLNGRSWGVEWNGADATIILNDEGYQIIPEPKGGGNIDAAKVPGSGNPHPAHVRNFLDCVKSRQQPVLNLEIGHHVSTVAHLGNIAYRTGRKINWDGKAQKIIGDREADKLVGVKYRKPWHLPYAERA
ncbi:MAG TPA: Gfo/Idh/MocA family oxidoreductase [Verrucomicrobiae bacterium]|nr:Gfo/Idh/MocA family oxidoreductase [Verrucomicrobiae bacterium]